MRKTLIALSILLVSPLESASPQSVGDRPVLALTNVTVIDTTGGPAKVNMTVLIQGQQIVSVGPTAAIPTPKDAHVIDAAGKFLIPGLWDMHVHGTGRPGFLDLFIANGVTGVRDMFGPLDEIQRRREEIRAGARFGPRIVAAGRMLDGPNPIIPGATAINRPDEGRDAVIGAKKEGSDFIKVYSLLSRDSYYAIASEAKRQALPFAGHVPEAVSVAEASDAGQKSIEHLTGILLGCSTKESELRQRLIDDLKRGEGFSAAHRTFLLGQIESLESYSEDKAQALFERLVKNHTWQCPTLTVLRGFALLDTESFTNDSRLKYLSAWQRFYWDPKTSFVVHYLTKRDFADLKREFHKELELVGKMRRAGVELLAGTDTSGPYCFPGFSLHDELALLVEAGLSPMEALQSATINPARFLGQFDRLGTVDSGKAADLVLLDADPLQDIRNSQKIRAVVVGGRIIQRPELDAMMKAAEASAGDR